MTRTEVTVPTADGHCSATLHQPDRPGPYPGVILYPDAGGVRETFSAMADTLAGSGFVVLLPDVYYRAPYRPFEVPAAFGDPAEMARLGELIATLTTEMIVRDAAAYLTFLTERDDVSGSLAATVGYCMGGRTSLLAAGHHPGRVAAAASFHGGQLAAANDPDSPHHVIGGSGARVYVAAAENDEHCPPEQLDLLGQTLRDAGADYDIETYPAAHGFAVPDNPTFDQDASERHWQSLLGLLQSTLG